MTLPRCFSQEVLDMFVDNLEGDRIALKQCCLVSRSMATAGQRNLFRHIHVYVDATRPNPLNQVVRLSNLFDRSPHLINHVRSLHLSLGVSPNSAVAPPNRRTQQDIMADILLKLGQLTRITLDSTSSLTAEVLIADFSTALVEALRATFASPRITHIRIASWIFPGASLFFDLLGKTPRPLASFGFTSVFFQTTKPRHIQWPALKLPDTEPVVIDKLVLDGCEAFDVMKWVNSSDHTIHVKKLVLALDRRADILAPIMHLFASSAEELLIRQVTNERPYPYCSSWNRLARGAQGDDSDDDTHKAGVELMPLVNLRTVTLCVDHPGYDSIFKKLGKGNVIETIALKVRPGMTSFFHPERILQLTLCEPTNFPCLQRVTLDFVSDFRTAESFRRAASWLNGLIEKFSMRLECPDGEVFIGPPDHGSLSQPCDIPKHTRYFLSRP